MDIGEQTEGTAADRFPGLELIEQPGGRVAVVNGVPVRGEGATVHGETWAALGTLAMQYGWVAPLVEAALLAGAAERPGTGARFTTVYGIDDLNEFRDKDKHAAYVASFRANVERTQRWLMAAFDSAGASINMSTGHVSIGVPTRPGVQWDVPALLPMAALLPFADDDEVKH